MLVFTFLFIILSCCNASDLYYTNSEEAYKEIQCLEDDICNVFIYVESADTSTIQCPLNADCNIHCYGKYSCALSLINCPKSANCIIKCNGHKSCKRFTVKSPLSGNLLSIECNEIGACDHAIIFSVNNIGGRLHIAALDGDIYGKLSDAKIECPKNGICELNVAGFRAMNDAVINATLSKSLHIKARGKKTLESSKIYCPIDGIDNKEQKCIVEVDSDGMNVLYKTEIYAVESFKDLKLLCSGGKCDKRIADGSANAPILFCKEDYETNCRLLLSDDGWLCRTRSECQDGEEQEEVKYHGEL